MNLQTQLRHWIRTGNVPRRAEFGPDFQNDWQHTPRNYIHALMGRDRVIRDFGFALPCREAIDKLKALSPIVEVGAGTGAWAALLAKNGADIIATDAEFDTGYRFLSGRFCHVSRMNAKNAIRKWPKRNVLMIWPCYRSEWSTEAIREIKPGRTLALISEGEGGCVGTDSLFRNLDVRFKHIERIKIPCWYGIHDRLDIYRRIIAAPANPEDF